MDVQQQPQQRFFHMPRLQNFQKTPIYANFRMGGGQQNQNQGQPMEFDGKRLRKAVTRKTVDYNSSINKYLENRIWQRDYRDRRAIQPDVGYSVDMVPPIGMVDNPINAVTTKFVRTSTNKMRCPIFCVSWTPEGRRLITGASSGEFTLWNGLTFNFETILQAHDAPVRCMVWSHNDTWMVTGDHAGYIKYWQSNMNNVKMFQGHKEPLRGISFCPTDSKFASCSDDGTVRIWDFYRGAEETVLRGHGADVKCVAWHPQKALLVSGSKDSQQPVKLWDPRSGQSLATIHAHKSTVMEAKWNNNGNWLLTASRDHLLKLFDIRCMNQEVQVFRGHKREACSLAWHPVHETLFASGGSDGCIMFWIVGTEKEVGGMEQAHDSCVWSVSWHPLGHILCSGSNDHTSKFWTRNRPGDRMRDKYNLNTMPKGIDENAEFDELSLGATPTIPGMGLEDQMPSDKEKDAEGAAIPGLELGGEEPAPQEKPTPLKKVPFSKPIPRQFQQKWQESKQPLLLAPPAARETNYFEVHSPDPHHYFASGVRVRAPPPNKYVLVRNPSDQTSPPKNFSSGGNNAEGSNNRTSADMPPPPAQTNSAFSGPPPPVWNFMENNGNNNFQQQTQQPANFPSNFSLQQPPPNFQQQAPPNFSSQQNYQQTPNSSQQNYQQQQQPPNSSQQNYQQQQQGSPNPSQQNYQQKQQPNPSQQNYQQQQPPNSSQQNNYQQQGPPNSSQQNYQQQGLQQQNYQQQQPPNGIPHNWRYSGNSDY